LVYWLILLPRQIYTTVLHGYSIKDRYTITLIVSMNIACVLASDDFFFDDV